MVKLLLAWFMLIGADPITVSVTPRMGFAPTGIRISVKVEPKDTNRGVTVIIDGEHYYRSSFDPDYDGEKGAAVGNYFYELRDPGHYLIKAILHRAEPDKNQQSTTTLCLAGTDVEC